MAQKFTGKNLTNATFSFNAILKPTAVLLKLHVTNSMIDPYNKISLIYLLHYTVYIYNIRSYDFLSYFFYHD